MFLGNTSSGLLDASIPAHGSGLLINSSLDRELTKAVGGKLPQSPDHRHRQGR